MKSNESAVREDPNRLEQRMGRIHRYGQRRDCLIFNFVAGIIDVDGVYSVKE